MWRSTLKIGTWGLILAVILITGLYFVFPKSTANIDAVDSANRLYSSGNYEKAIEIYEQLVKQGVFDSVVFYNLGNAYFSIGDTGSAVAYYDRASQLDPRDPDIRANRELARSQLNQLYLDTDSGFAGVLAGITDGWLSFSETAIIFLTLWFLLAFLIIGTRTVGDGNLQTTMKYVIYVVLILLLVSGVSLVGRVYEGQVDPEGVVLEPSIAVVSKLNDEVTSDSILPYIAMASRNRVFP